MNIKSTKVFKINGILFVADSIEDAIRIFREKYSFTIDIEHIVLITGDNSNLAWTEDTSALFDSFALHYQHSKMLPRYHQHPTMLP